ncbi:MAG: class I SAM-dependent methyltransferase [Herpetosiphon sp.]
MDRTADGTLFQMLEQSAAQDGKQAYFRLHRHRFAIMLSALRVGQGKRVLEVGVTPGQFTQLLVGAGYQVSGVDLEPSKRQELWERLGVDVRKANLDDEPVPFPDASFDYVVFSEVIEHLLYSPLPLLRELRRVLVPGGILLITTPNELYAKSRLRTLLRVLLWQSLATDKEFRQQAQLEGTDRYTTHSHTYTMRELCWVVEQAGFRVIRRRYEAPWEQVGLEPGRFRRHPVRVAVKTLFATLTRLLPGTRSMLLVIGRKP